MRNRNITILEVTIIVTLMFALVVFLVVGGGYLGFDPVVTSNVIQLIPPTIVIALGFIILAALRGYWCIIGAGGIGVAAAFMLNTFDTLGLITVDMFWGLSIVGVQVYVIIVSLLIGSILGAYSR